MPDHDSDRATVALTDAVHDARAHVPPVAPGELVAEVRASRRARTRSHRKVVGGLAGAAAIVLIAGAVVALTNRDPSQGTTIAAGALTDGTSSQTATSSIREQVVANPSTNLTDGQKITVTAYGFDAGTTVTFFQCVVSGPTLAKPPSAATDSDLLSHSLCIAAPLGKADSMPAGSDGSQGDRETVATQRVSITTSFTDRQRLSLPKDQADPSGSFVVKKPVAEHSPCRGVPNTPSFRSHPEASFQRADHADHSDPSGGLHIPQSQCVVAASGSIGGTRTIRFGSALTFANAPAHTFTPPPSSTSTPAGSDPGAPAPSVPSTTATTTPPLATTCPDSASVTVPSIDDADLSAPLLDFTPTRATVCRYPLMPQKHPSVTITQPAQLTRLTSDIASLPAASAAGACTADAGETITVALIDGARTTTITAQIFGCGYVSNGTALRAGSSTLSWLLDLEP